MDWASIISSVIQTALIAALTTFGTKVIIEIKSIAEIKPTLASLNSKVGDMSSKIDTLSKCVDDDAKRIEEHDYLDDSALVFSMRDHLLGEHDRLVMKGWADYAERSSWHDAFDTYQKLVEASGQTNGVMGDYAEDIDELPTSKPAE